MNIALIDVDNYHKMSNCFPNIGLMKISSYHKSKGENVEWYQPGKHYDLCYKSKVFTFTPDVNFNVDADRIIKGGTGYAIKLVDDKELYDPSLDPQLPDVIEHIYPDYGLYGIEDTAYGFMSRGCPRGCNFCHVAPKEGRRSLKVANLNEFWRGQKYIEIMDPNTFACSEWKEILLQLAESGSYVSFNQGIDIRILNEEKIEALLKLKIKMVHFAWDRFEDGDIIKPKLKQFKDITGWKRQKVMVYVLTNFDTSISQDVERVEYIRSLGFQPYIMRYDKEHISKGSEINKLARYVNNIRIFWSCDNFEKYKKEYAIGLWR